MEAIGAWLYVADDARDEVSFAPDMYTISDYNMIALFHAADSRSLQVTNVNTAVLS